MSWLWDYARGVSAAYGVDPRVYLALVLVTIPPFYFALGMVVRDLARTRENGGGVSLAKAFRSRSFVVALFAMVLLWLAPYIYVALWGRHLPAWLVVAFVAFMLIGGISLVRRVRRRAAIAGESEQPK
jgi:hypothetical protein